MGIAIRAAVMIATATFAVACSSNEEPLGSSAESALVAGRQLTEAEVAQVVRSAGFPENMVGTMVCTAKYESSFYDRATNNNTNGTTDYGLFQINSIHIGGTGGCPSSAEPLFDVSTNAACALAIYRMQGINAWYGYKKHKAECDAYPAPASSGVPLQPPTGGVTVPIPEPVGPGVPQVPTAPPPTGGPTGTPTGGAFVDPSTPGSCYSPYLRMSTVELACVQSARTGEWVQCARGQWYRPVDIRTETGPFGPCRYLVTP